MAPVFGLLGCDTRLANGVSPFAHLLECKVITDNGDDDRTVYVPRMTFVVAPEASGLDYEFKRVQFPVTLAFAMTIHKSQGQTFDRVGIYLEHPVFTHGQLYVALSRCRNPDQLKVFILCDSDDPEQRRLTANIVWQEVLFNEPPSGATAQDDHFEQLLHEDDDSIYAGVFEDGEVAADEAIVEDMDIDRNFTVPTHNSNLRRRNA